MSLVIEATNAAQLEVLIKYGMPEATLRLPIANQESFKSFKRIQRSKYTAIGPGPTLVKIAVLLQSINRLFLIFSGAGSDTSRSNILYVIFTGLKQGLRPFQRWQLSLLF